MQILVLGSGLLGVTTAYELGKRGFDVTVIDRQAASGAETSHANGGQMSYTHAEPWASPSTLLKLPKWIFRSDAPLIFRPRADLHMAKWLYMFLRNCTPGRTRANCVNVLRLGLYSRKKLEEIRQHTGIEFDFSGGGILHIFDGQKEFDHARRQSDFQAKFGGSHRELTPAQCLELEPTLAHTSRSLIGGMHAFQDEIGDSYRYCNALANFAAKHYGVKFRYGITITGLRAENKSVSSVLTSDGIMTADAYVMAMGSYSSPHLRKIGIGIPVYPMKGYSVTIEANDFCPRRSITDITHKIVYTRLGNKLRVSGTAEFAGYNDSLNERRINPIVKTAQAFLPKADWGQDIKKWACLRPSTPDGPPIIGPTPLRNLFLNTGHGTLGWTQAAGSATIVADLMEGKIPEIMLNGLTYGRL